MTQYHQNCTQIPHPSQHHQKLSEVASCNLPLPHGSTLLLITLEMPFPGLAPTIPVVISLPSTVRNADISNLIANLHPSLTASRDRTDATQDVVSATRYQETAKEIQIVDIGRARRDRFSNCANEANDVNQDAADIRRVAAPVKAESEIVRRSWAGGVEISDLIVAAADDIVIADDDSSDGREEDGVG